MFGTWQSLVPHPSPITLYLTSEDSSSSLSAAFRFCGCLPLPAGLPRGLLPPSPAAGARFRGAAAPLALAREGVLAGELPLSVTGSSEHMARAQYLIMLTESHAVALSAFSAVHDRDQPSEASCL